MARSAELLARFAVRRGGMRTIGELVQKTNSKDGAADVTAVARQRAVALANCLLALRIP